DYGVADDTGRVLREGDLGAFAGQAGRALLISLDDERLGAALRADPYLLEKAARTCQSRSPALVWLVTVAEEGAAYPGYLVAHGELLEGARCVGLIVRLGTLLEHPHIPRTDA